MLKNNYKSISKKYLARGRGTLTKEEIAAYFAARMPATYAAVSQALKEVSKKITYNMMSVLDLGTGLGAGTIAAKEIFPHIERAMLIEKNEEMITKGKEIIDKEWVRSDLKSASFPPHDLVLFSYSYGELPEKSRKEVLKKGWDAAEALLIVEPGTPRGFEGIMEARLGLI